MIKGLAASGERPGAGPGPIAQLARAPRLHRGCRGFESLWAHCLHAGVDTKVFCRKDVRRYDFSLILCGSRTLVPAACGCVRAWQKTISVKPVGIPPKLLPPAVMSAAYANL